MTQQWGPPPPQNTGQQFGWNNRAPGAWPQPQGAPQFGPQGYAPPAQGFQQAYQPGYQQPGSWPNQALPQFQPAPQRRRGRGGAIGAVIGALVLVGVVFFVARGVSAMVSSSSTSTTNSSGNGGTTPNGTAPYANESYSPPPADLNPPDLPAPKTYGQATTMLNANAIYSQTTPKPTNCSKVVDVDASTATVAELTAHLNELMGCLMTTWNQPVTAAGYVLPRPSVTVYTRTIQTACGTIDSINAMYCAADQQVYYAKALPQALPAALRSAKFVTELVVAHEFGHAIQGRTGILYSEKAWESKSSKSEAMTYSRRLEQQADCFAGEFVSSIAQSKAFTDADLTTLTKVMNNLGDDVISGDPTYVGGHGSGKNRQAWFTKGYNDTALTTCNTFTAPASSVK